MPKQIVSLVVVIHLSAMAVAPAGDETPDAARSRLFINARSHDGATVVVLDESQRSRLQNQGQPFTIESFPLDAGRGIDLVVEPFRVTRPSTRFVIGRRNGDDMPLDFDPSRVNLLRGRVAGRGGSHVFLAIHDSGSFAMIQPGHGARQRLYASKAGDGTQMVMSVGGQASGALPAGLPLCGLNATTTTAARDLSAPVAAATGTISRGMQVLELAVETDYEFYQLFGDADAAAAYIVEMFAIMSDVYIRDVNTRIELSFVRIWDTPDDLFNEPDPLFAFREYWNDSMGDVQRDAAQFVSGRRDLPYGGVAWLGTLCGSLGYSVVGYIQGFSTSNWQPHIWNYDARVAAHELGHNCDSNHTHAYGIDICNSLDGPSRRGTIMAYCGQTRSGGNANQDMRFHATVQDIMESFITAVQCVADDCNSNSIDDTLDIQFATSDDENANGVPDECEDCNTNTVLDDQDIAQETSFDVNGNGLPDECESDCNGNQIPDTWDIFLNNSSDLYGNNIPDACEPDCDGDGQSDYNEILADMTLDINRDTVLDACEDCDGDGTVDADALAHAHNMWVASTTLDVVGEFHAATGVRVRTSEAGQVSLGADLVIAPDGRVLVSSALDHRVVAFDSATGAYVSDFVPAGDGGLSRPAGLTFGANGNLFVCSELIDSVLEYDGNTGSFVGVFVATGAGGLLHPTGLTFGPNGNLFVCSRDDQVLQYDGSNGAFIAPFVVAADNGGLSAPKGLVFKPDGNLLVASYLTDEVLEYDGDTGAFLQKFNHNGTEVALTLDRPWCLRVGPNGNVYVSRSRVGQAAPEVGDSQGRAVQLHLNTTRIFEFDVANGNFIRSYVLGNDSELSFPTGFDFAPGWQSDCNLNSVPDPCDISNGISLDDNGNGVPDACEVDCNANSTMDRLDVIPFGDSYDCNHNLVPDECDLALGNASDCDGDGRIDACNDGGVCILPGDTDGDGDVDLVDFTVFDACITGPGGTIPPGCQSVDIDQDADVDMRDFVVFQAFFNG